MSFGIIIATHAHIGEALLEGAEMLAGKQARVRTLSLTENKSVETFEQEFDQAYAELAGIYDHVVVLCDIYGGSPFNVTSRKLLSGCEATAYTGVNLPVLIDLLFCDELSPLEVETHVKDTYAQACQRVEVTLPDSCDSDEDLDL